MILGILSHMGRWRQGKGGDKRIFFLFVFLQEEESHLCSHHICLSFPWTRRLEACLAGVPDILAPLIATLAGHIGIHIRAPEQMAFNFKKLLTLPSILRSWVGGIRTGRRAGGITAVSITASKEETQTASVCLIPVWFISFRTTLFMFLFHLCIAIHIMLDPHSHVSMRVYCMLY